jgi:hypothetical protein
LTRPKNIRNRGTINHVFDLDYYEKFIDIVGTGNASDEFRAFVKDRVDQASRQEGSITDDNNKRESQFKSTLFMFLDNKDVRNDLVKLIDMEMDMNKLNILYRNCKTVVGMIERRKLQNHAVALANKRSNTLKSNEEIENDVKEYRRRQRV